MPEKDLKHQLSDKAYEVTQPPQKHLLVVNTMIFTKKVFM